MEIEYLTYKQVNAINQRITTDSVEIHAIENQANLEYLIEAVKYKYENKEFEESVILKSAFLLDALANKGHVFVEGNKRTAITSTIAFLNLNRFEIDTEDQKAIADFVLNVAKGKRTLRQAAKWIRQRLKKRA